MQAERSNEIIWLMINNVVKHCAIYFLLFADLPKRMSSLYCALSAIKEANTSQKFPIDMLKIKLYKSVPVLCTICKTEKLYQC